MDKQQTQKRQRNALFNLAMTFVIAMAMLGISILFVSGPRQVDAAPGYAPTPVANTEADGSSRYLNVVFQDTTAITADTNTSGKQLPGYEYMDISATLDQGSVNTTTLTVQFSNDNSNWDDGPALVTSNDTDATEMTRIPLFGRYVRVEQDVTNSNAVTITLLAVAK